MEEKKSIKVSLGTLIFIVIIVLLIEALVGMYYYYNFVIPNNNNINNDSNISDNTVVNNTVIENTEREETVNSVVNEEKIDSAETSDDNKDYITFKDVVGNYYAVEDYVDPNSKNTRSDESVQYSLYLTDVGTYYYEQCVTAPFGLVGNYIIEGNKIILNKLFYTNSSAEVTAASGTIELTFNQDGTITDSKGISEKSVVLKKDSTKEDEFDVKKGINLKIQEYERYTL